LDCSVDGVADILRGLKVEMDRVEVEEEMEERGIVWRTRIEKKKGDL